MQKKMFQALGLNRQQSRLSMQRSSLVILLLSPFHTQTIIENQLPQLFVHRLFIYWQNGIDRLPTPGESIIQIIQASLLSKVQFQKDLVTPYTKFPDQAIDFKLILFISVDLPTPVPPTTSTLLFLSRQLSNQNRSSQGKMLIFYDYQILLRNQDLSTTFILNQLTLKVYSYAVLRLIFSFPTPFRAYYINYRCVLFYIYNLIMESNIEVLVCGPTGVGKSSLIASFTEKVVQVGDQPQGVTKKISKFQANYRGYNYSFYDLPGFGDLDVGIDQLIQMWNSELSKKKVVVLVVLNSMVKRMDWGTDAMLKLINRVFKDKGQDIKRGVVLVFSHQDKISNQQVQDHKKYMAKLDSVFKKRYNFVPQNKIQVSNNIVFREQLKSKLHQAVLKARPITNRPISIQNIQQIKKGCLGSIKCFSLINNVKVLQRGVLVDKLLGNIQPGEMVLTWNDKKQITEISEFITVIHYDSLQMTQFLQITLQNGKRITLTQCHLLKTDRGYVKASQLLQLGGQVQTIQGFQNLRSIRNVEFQGFCAPLTRSGNIVVNDIIASCYAKSSHLLGDIFSWPIRTLSNAEPKKQGYHKYFKALQSIGKALKIID